MTYSDFSEICHHPLGQSPFILKNLKDKTISPDLSFIKQEKQHDFLEYVAQKQQKIFFSHEKNKDLGGEEFLEKFFTFFQHFCQSNENANIGKNKNTSPINWPTNPPINPFEENGNKLTAESLFEKNIKNELLDDMISLLKPWRKGPFFFHGRKIESEWQSQKKWDRIKNVLQELPKNQATILDLGCNNGYYLFRLLFLKGLSPNYVVGIDPVGRYFFQYLFLLRIFGTTLPHLHTLHYFPIGYEAMPVFFTSTFSLILCMGIIYHHQNPLEIIKAVFNCLKPGGSAIFEVQGIEIKKNSSTKDMPAGDLNAGDLSAGNLPLEDLPLALFPQKTYTGKGGFWFLPCLNTLNYWLKRCGFDKITIISSLPLDLSEQAMSKDCPYPSLKEGIKEKQTLEGYPPPYRHLVLATK